MHKFNLIFKAKRRPFKDKNGRYTCVYVIRHVRSGCYYIGVHTDVTPNSVLATYFTSSELVQTIIKLEGSKSFVIEHLLWFNDRKTAEQVEDYLIWFNFPETNKYLLNKSYNKNKERKTTVWESQTYRGIPVKVNPKSPLLVETRFTGTKSLMAFPVGFK